MCGFAGYISKGNFSITDSIHYLKEMSATLTHRGPDDHGEWHHSQIDVGLSHRRLSIQDLSTSGHQPMQSATGRYMLVYNGEIYNFLSIRKELEQNGVRFRGSSDTEVILASFEQWGVNESLEKFIGMFAFALWDDATKELMLARDRLGEKPLYYGWQGNSFLFGSELKALRKHPHWQGRINNESLPLMLAHNYIPAPYTIYEDIFKLSPGSILVFNQKEQSFIIEKYWSLKDVFSNSNSYTMPGTPEKQADGLEALLLSSIRQQMIADVPVGAFLSGGIDSSTIVALMQLCGLSRVKTFSIGFENDQYNEAHYAKEISTILDTDHTELYVSPEQALAVIPELPRMFDEPFADSSQIPTYLVAKMARENVTVSLSGDGGDELFAGYTHYHTMNRMWRQQNRCPALMRKGIYGILNLFSEELIDSLANPFIKNFTNNSPHRFGERIKDRMSGWAATNLLDAYRHYISYWKRESPVNKYSNPLYVLNDKNNIMHEESVIKNLQYLDAMIYLPDDILTKVDRAAMSNSLETRVPLLDHRVVEYAFRIPIQTNLKHSSGKWPLRYILEKHVPAEVFERPKKGFGVPIADWLRAPLYDWGANLLDESLLQEQGFFYHKKVSNMWREHQQGTTDYSFQLWGVLMFQSWLEEYSNN